MANQVTYNPCPMCYGTGKSDQISSGICPACGGSGKQYTMNVTVTTPINVPITRTIEERLDDMEQMIKKLMRDIEALKWAGRQ